MAWLLEQGRASSIVMGVSAKKIQMSGVASMMGR
jgi:hypothetical protein